MIKRPVAGLFYAPILTCIFLKYTFSGTEATLISDIVGFDWDHGNHFKNQQKHSVETWECEQIFLIDLLSFMRTINTLFRKRDCSF